MSKCVSIGLKDPDPAMFGPSYMYTWRFIRVKAVVDTWSTFLTNKTICEVLKKE